jgi:DNA-binding transcriptional LysR family regulator
MTDPLAWTDLQVFLAVCEHGSIGGAAQALQVNHSTVLRRIAALEQALSVRLIDRLPRGYVLTAHGQELAASVAGVAERIDAAQRRVTGADLALSGTIRLTAPDALLHALLWPLLAHFRRRHPNVRLEVVAGNSFLNLTRREADVAVRGSSRPPEHLVGRRVGTLRTALHASRDYLATLDDDATDADYAWVGHDAALAHLTSARWMRKHVPDERVVLRVDTLVALADAVAAGVGVGWVLCPLAQSRPTLQALQPPRPELVTPVWVLTHPDLRQVARIKALTDFLHEQLSSDPRLAHA